MRLWSFCSDAPACMIGCHRSVSFHNIPQHNNKEDSCPIESKTVTRSRPKSEDLLFLKITKMNKLRAWKIFSNNCGKYMNNTIEPYSMLGEIPVCRQIYFNEHTLCRRFLNQSVYECHLFCTLKKSL